jgi:hypothetical protein
MKMPHATGFTGIPSPVAAASQLAATTRVVLSDVLGGKDVVEGRDRRTDGRTCRIVIGRIRVKTDLPPQIRFYILPLINTVG